MVLNGGVGKRLLNVEETAGYLGLKVDTVYKKARLRELRFVKVGRALRFDKQALDRLIEYAKCPFTKLKTKYSKSARGSQAGTEA
jgi:excisionase family DNA binding protein